VKGEHVACSNMAIEGLVETSNRVELIEYNKITVKMSWLFFAQTLEPLCDTENCEFFSYLKTLHYSTLLLQ
jgi:hypothetical protein